MKFTEYLLAKGGQSLNFAIVTGGAFVLGILAIIAVTPGPVEYARTILMLYALVIATTIVWVVGKPVSPADSLKWGRADFFQSPTSFELVILGVGLVAGRVLSLWAPAEPSSLELLLWSFGVWAVAAIGIVVGLVLFFLFGIWLVRNDDSLHLEDGCW